RRVPHRQRGWHGIEAAGSGGVGMTDLGLTEATRLRSEGKSLAHISRVTGLTLFRLHCLFDPGFLDRRNAQQRKDRLRTHEPVLVKLQRVDLNRPSPDEAAAALARIPPDTRPLTA